MPKKKIIILSLLILIIVTIVALVLPKNNKINLMQENKVAEYKYSTTIGEAEYDITKAVQEPDGVVPTLSAGMIPIKLNGESWVIADKKDWYDYSNGNPAYMMLSDGYYKSELERGIKEDQLYNNSVGKDASVRLEDLGTIYMWVPRFAYNAQGEIIYIKQECSVAGTWKIPEIFIYETKNVDLSLAGLWVEYNPLKNEDEVNSKIEEMNKEDNEYGLIANTVATNANDDTTYKTTIETFIANVVGVDAHIDPIIEAENPNRTILKIVNTNKREPIRGTATLNEEELTITINISYTKNGIKKIIDISNRVIGENSNMAEEKLSENSIGEYIVIDNIGNMKKIEEKIFVIPNIERLVEFRDRVNAGEDFEGVTVLQVADIDMSSVCSESLGSWEPIGVCDLDFWLSYEENKLFAGTYNRNVPYN